VRRLAAILLLLASACSGFDRPTASQLEQLRLPEGRTSPFARRKFRMSVDSPWLAGEFDGVAQARLLTGPPAVRVQVFGDLGPKMMDLLARTDRIAGYFPQPREGVDCALPSEAAPHLILFMGATLLEDFLPLRLDRVEGIREEEEGAWLRLSPVVPGLGTDVFLSKSGEIRKRRFRWMYGIRWEETLVAAEDWRITAPDIDIRLKVVGRDQEPLANPGVFEMTLPGDVRLSLGSRK
jgi:hypothetical protein